MDRNLIPKTLHHLISKVEKWGIEDDGYRDELVYNSPTDGLRTLVNSLTDDDLDNLNDWLTEDELIKSPTNEYLKFSAFFMAYEYAESVLKRR
ncbi:MAG: hypothetical protein AAFN93_14975 [Bacteroidota bacterium]